jgi:hypothetical protein
MALNFLSVLDFDSTALRLLSSPSISEDARQEASERADSGERLIKIKEKLQHGQWLSWVQTNPFRIGRQTALDESFKSVATTDFRIGRQTALDWMNVAENIKLPPGGNLSMFQTKAVYLLASPSTPEPAR